MPMEALAASHFLLFHSVASGSDAAAKFSHLAKSLSQGTSDPHLKALLQEESDCWLLIEEYLRGPGRSPREVIFSWLQSIYLVRDCGDPWEFLFGWLRSGKTVESIPDWFAHRNSLAVASLRGSLLEDRPKRGLWSEVCTPITLGSDCYEKFVFQILLGLPCSFTPRDWRDVAWERLRCGRVEDFLSDVEGVSPAFSLCSEALWGCCEGFSTAESPHTGRFLLFLLAQLPSTAERNEALGRCLERAELPTASLFFYFYQRLSPACVKIFLAQFRRVATDKERALFCDHCFNDENLALQLVAAIQELKDEFILSLGGEVHQASLLDFGFQLPANASLVRIVSWIRCCGRGELLFTEGELDLICERAAAAFSFFAPCYLFFQCPECLDCGAYSEKFFYRFFSLVNALSTNDLSGALAFRAITGFLDSQSPQSLVREQLTRVLVFTFASQLAADEQEALLYQALCAVEQCNSRETFLKILPFIALHSIKNGWGA